jgi:SAM-dependent methyltransferase
VGYDAYNEANNNQDLLTQTYDFVVSQDVLEHVEQPSDLLDEFNSLTRPSGVIVIGTPDASAIDLRRPEAYRHTLHAPYHRHILSKGALAQAGGMRGWRREHFYSTQYANTRVPLLNSRTYQYCMSLRDNSLDSLLSPPPVVALLARLPLTLFWGLFGSWLARATDVMFVFRRAP